MSGDGRISQNTSVTVGLIHPGEMGAAVGATLRGVGETVLWASAGRSAATVEGAQQAGLEDVGSVQELSQRCDLLICLCPPHAAVAVAEAVPAFPGIYVDANAISPARARALAASAAMWTGVSSDRRRVTGDNSLYLSGLEAGSVAEVFGGTTLAATVVSDQPGVASALKMAYAAWTKGSAALLLATRAVARADGVEEALLREWRTSRPHLEEQSAAAAGSALREGWRWIGEMEEIAQTFAAADLPDGFHLAAAEMYRRAANEAVDAENPDPLFATIAARAAGDLSDQSRFKR
jgi:3-hydroxyisobutyrate dehydrogenase-like beta-hydroxyacid dehydrogenase